MTTTIDHDRVFVVLEALSRGVTVLCALERGRCLRFAWLDAYMARPIVYVAGGSLKLNSRGRLIRLLS